MAISPHFLSAFQRSPAWGSKTLSFQSGSVGSAYENATVAATYGKFEWSYEPLAGGTGWLIKGGTDLACQHGASALAEALGYRFYWPYTQSWKIPQTLDTAATAAKQKFLMPDNVMALAYGMGSMFPTQDAEWNRWCTLNAVDQEFYLAGHRWNSIGSLASIRNSNFWIDRPGVLNERRKIASPESGAAFVPDNLPPTGNPPVITFTTLNTTAYQCGSDRWKFDFTCDHDDGNLYVVMSRSSTKPTAQQIADGQNHLGDTIPSRVKAITASGTYTKYVVPLDPPVGGPTTVTPIGALTYYLHAVYRTSGGVFSNVVTSVQVKPLQPNTTFEIQTAVDNGWYDDLVELCAGYLLDVGLNEFNASSFDAADTDDQASDVVFPFTFDVATRVRAGTNPIGPYGTKTGKAGAQLGIYAYAGHRLPPAASVSPGVVTQVALGFNKTEYTYPELVYYHALKSDGIKLREYWGTPIWDRGQPILNGRTKSNYFESYTDSDPAVGYIAAAAAAGKDLLGTHAECSANHLANLVMWRWGFLTLRGVITTYDACLQEIVDDIFDGDPKVTELYQFFSYRLNRWHKYSLQTAMEIIDEMQPSWYKTLYQYWMVFCYEWLTLPNQLAASDANNGGPSDPFPDAFYKMMSHAWSLAPYHIIQSYGVGRVEANGRVNANYPELRYDLSPQWRIDAEAGLTMPTTAEFDAYLADLQANNDRDPDLDSADVVIVRGLTSSDGTTTPGTGFYHRATAQYGVVGPARIKLEWDGDTGDVGTGGDDSGEPEQAEPGVGYLNISEPGWQTFDVLASAKVTPVNGELLFLICFPSVLKYSDGNTGDAFLYIQDAVDGEVRIQPGSRCQLHDQTGAITIYPEGSASYAGPYNQIGPGVVRVNYTNTQGITVENGNPYMSMFPDIHAMARGVANDDFGSTPGVVKISRG